MYYNLYIGYFLILSTRNAHFLKKFTFLAINVVWAARIFCAARVVSLEGVIYRAVLFSRKMAFSISPATKAELSLWA